MPGPYKPHAKKTQPNFSCIWDRSDGSCVRHYPKRRAALLVCVTLNRIWGYRRFSVR